jgi:hypothetical protein
MALVKITFDSASVTAKQDAECNHFLASNQNGRIPGLGGVVGVSTSNNYIILSSGYIQVYGRRIFVEQNTKIQVALDGSAYGYVFIKFDVGNNAVSLEKREASSTYPSLTQENLLTGGLVYEFPVGRYTKTTSALNLDTYYTSPQIKNADELAASRAATVTSQTEYYYGPRFQQTYTSVSGKFFTYASIHSVNADKGMGNIYIEGWNLVFSTWAVAGSGAKYQYKVGSTWYDVGLQLTSNGLIVETASTSHKPGWVYVTR